MKKKKFFVCRKIEKNSKICLTKDFFSLRSAHEKNNNKFFYWKMFTTFAQIGKKNEGTQISNLSKTLFFTPDHKS